MKSKKVSPSTVISRNLDVPFSQLDDELLAIDAQAGYLYSLNETAGRVWDLIAEPTSFEKICQQLLSEYAVDESTCQQEVVKLLQGLIDAGLIQATD